MFTKNWYKLFATYATYAKGGLKGVASDGSEYKLEYSTANNNLGSAMLYPLLSTVNFRSLISNYGTYFGTGNTAPALDDYNLSGSRLTDSSNIASSVSISSSADDDGITMTAVYTLTNNGTNDVTVGEIALFAFNASYQYYLVERTVLDTPVIIPAGGVGQVTYTIRMNYPT